MEQVFEVTPNSFQADVVKRSDSMPILLLFWAEQAQPSQDAKRQLTGMVGQYSGRVALGLVNVAADQALAQHLRVQALPSLRVIHKGQVVQQLEGPQPEQALRTLLDQLTMTAGEVVKAQLGEYLERGDLRSAERFLRQALREEANNPLYRVELADVLARRGELKEARKMLATVPADADQRSRPETRLELADEAAQLPPQATLKAQLQQDPKDLEARRQLSVVEAAAGNFEAALEHALHILQADRSFLDDVGRVNMVRIFRVLGKDNELANRYRRKMFNFMH